MLKSLCSALMILCTGSLLAYNHPAPGSFGFTGEYLYMRPSVDDTYFVIQSPVTTAFPNGTRIHNNFHYHSGFRVAASYGFCGCDSDLSIDYVWLKANQNRTVTGAFLWATVGNPDLTGAFENYTGSATSELHLLYERVDPLYSQSIYNCCGLNFRVLAGLEYAHLRLNENYAYTITTTGTATRRSKTWGVGPQAGFDLEYDLLQNDRFLPGSLSLNVTTTGSIITGGSRTQTTAISAGGATLVNVNDRTDWRVIPAIHARVGFNYDFCLFGMGAGFGIGYEFSTYLRGLTKTIFPDDALGGQGFSHNNYYNFDVQGLYVNTSVNF